MAKEASTQILLLAPNLLGESLAMQLAVKDPDTKIILDREKLTKNPSLVIWFVESLEMPSIISNELKRLQEEYYDFKKNIN